MRTFRDQLIAELSSIPPIFNSIVLVLEEINEIAQCSPNSKLSKHLFDTVNIQSLRRSAETNNLDIEIMFSLIRSVCDGIDNTEPFIRSALASRISRIRGLSKQPTCPEWRI